MGDGFEFANRQVAFRTESKGGQLEVRMISTECFDGAICTIYQDNKEIFKSSVNLTPAKVMTFAALVPAGKEVRVVLVSAAGS